MYDILCIVYLSYIACSAIYLYRYSYMDLLTSSYFSLTMWLDKERNTSYVDPSLCLIIRMEIFVWESC